MKLTSPEDMTDLSKLASVLNEFEEKFLKEEKGQTYYHLVITGEYSRALLDKVEQAYKEAGWKNVACTTSSENGERPGLTGLQLSI